MISRRTALFAALAAGLSTAARAHHGLMIWDKETLVMLTGIVTEPMDGFPHWEIEVRVDGVDWVIDLGSDFDMERAGLHTDGREFSIGAEVIVEGYRPKGSDARLIRPRRVTVGGTTYEFKTEWD